MGQSNKNNKLIIGLIVIILAVIILLGIYYLFFSETEKIIEKPEIIIETDNRISPNENQGLTLEVLRIRNRELLNKIMNSGNSWKNKPNLYFITEIDGQEYISKNVGSASRGITETFFMEWDTIHMENKIVKDAEEEQEISYVTLRIMERKKE